MIRCVCRLGPIILLSALAILIVRAKRGHIIPDLTLHPASDSLQIQMRQIIEICFEARIRHLFRIFMKIENTFLDGRKSIFPTPKLNTKYWKFLIFAMQPVPHIF